MGKKKFVVPLLLACVVAVAVPYFTGVFDDDETDQAEPSTGEGAYATDSVEASADGDDASSSGAGSPADQLIVDDLIQATDPSSPHSDLIRSRLDPLTEAAGEDIEPFSVPEATTLYQATLAHPAHTQSDLHYVESLQPLPEDLDHALAQVVLAHGVSTTMLSKANPAPGVDLAASVTMATALDQAMPTLDRYVDHPIWDSPPTTAEGDAGEITLEAPPLAEALLDLYSALGYDQATLDALEPQVRQAAAELGPEESRALAQLVTAKADVQRATAGAIAFFATPASHPQGPVQDATRQVDGELAGTPLEALTTATEQLRMAAETAHETIHDVQDDAPGEDDAPDEDDAPGEGDLPETPGPVREEPWVDPLGLIVIGTRGSDTYDSRYGGDPAELGLVTGTADEARETIGAAEANTTDPDTLPTVDEAVEQGPTSEAGADAANRSTVPEAGWHMLVLDPGGDDVYRNNAGGIDAGSIIVRAEMDARGLKDGAQTLIVRGDRVCDPLLGQCEPPVPGAPPLGQLLRNMEAEGPSADTGEMRVGMPLTATVVDVDGDDTYEDTGPVIQGAASGVGVGLLFDRAGDDTYNATHMAQGAAEDFGVGLLVDGDGNDTYTAEDQAQGWVDVPNPRAEASFTTTGFTPSQRIHFMLARVTEGALVDTGGHDDHQLEDLFAGQGMAQLPDGFARRIVHFFGYPVEHATAQLVDVGGDEQLPVPAREIRGQTVEMTPSRANVSGEQVTHFWLTRRTPQDPGSQFNFFEEDVQRYKTALHVDPDTAPDPIEEDAIRVGSIDVECRENGGGAGIFIGGGQGNRQNGVEGVICVTDQVADTPDLLLFGEPDRVQDPPALTLTFGGDTHYNGTIAAVTPEGFGISSSPNDGAEGGIVEPPRILADLGGNDTYTGGNETIAVARNNGVAMVVDRVGSDEMVAGNRSVAHTEVTTPLGLRHPVAAVLDLDGDLTVETDDASQAYAAQQRDEALFGDENQNVDVGDTLGLAVSTMRAPPPMSLLDAGAQADVDPSSTDDDATLPTGRLDLHAGNTSQGYSEGLGVALLVGSPGDDRYEVDGWGQGVHEQMQGLARFCDDDDDQSNNPPAHNIYSGLDPWLGGVGLVADPDGDDTYVVNSGVGLGDAKTDSASCSEGGATNLRGSNNVNLLGLGAVLDVRGQDSYEITDSPPRPDEFPPRSCSGTNRSECEPGDDRAWMTIDEEPVTEVRGVGVYNSPAAIGLGVDNVRNAHHLAAAACRNADLFTEPGGLMTRTVRPAAEDQHEATGPILFLECDETIRALVDELPVDPFAELPTRQLSLELALPGSGDEVSLASGQRVDPSDQLLSDRVPLPEGVSVPDDPEPLFLSDVAQAQCEDRESTTEVTTRGRPDVACLSITRDVDIGQWLTDDPRADRLDPGDTVACNCSVRLEVSALQNASGISLQTTGEEDLYPDRGRITTFTTATGTWYEAFNRFRVPLTVEDPIQDGRLRGDFTKAEAAADFPVNLSALPTGIATVEVTAVVEDMTSEESGGIVDETVQTWRSTLYHERTFEQAHVAEVDGDTVLFLEAPGPVDPDDRPRLTVNATDAVHDELTGEDWLHLGDDRYTRELPRANVIDGPSRSPIVAQEGAPACASLILDADNDAEGICWTGEAFVVGLPLGEMDPARLDAVHAGETPLATSNLSLADSDAEPSLRFGSEEDHSVDLGGVLDDPDVFGLPGTTLLDDGEAFVEALIEDRTTENWALVTVEPDEDEAAGIAPLGLLHANESKVPTHASHPHTELHETVTTNHTTHPHVEVLTPAVDTSGDDEEPDFSPREDEPLLIEGETVFDIERHVLGCASLNYVKLDDARRVIHDETDRFADLLSDGDTSNDPKLSERTCLTFAGDGEANYLIPLGDYTGTQLIRLETQLLQTDGEFVTEQIVGHLDPRGVQGQVSLQPASSGEPESDIRLQIFPQTAEDPRLTDGESDLVRTELQVRPQEGNWTSLGDVWGTLPTPDHPNVETTVDLAPFVEENASTSIVEVRGIFQDESNNTLPTNVREFVLDRAPPNVTAARVVSGADQSRLMVTIDEAIDSVSCVDEECALEAQATVPGAQPEPFLDSTRLSIGPRAFSMPILDLQRGPAYDVSLELTDTLGNTAIRNITVDTFTPLAVDASPMSDTLVNKTITLNWTAKTKGDQTLSTFTNAYLMLPDGPCPVLQGNPGVIPAHESQPQEKGPLSVRGETGERACEVPDEGVDAELIIYALAPRVDALALDQVPVHVDTADPTVELDAPEGWVNESAEIQARSNDSLVTQLELFVDEEPRRVDGETGSTTVSGEGVHDVLARATDAAGNSAVNQTTVRIDETSPGVSADVLGVRGGLALVNATAVDELSGVKDLQLSTRSTSGPLVPDVGGESVLLSVPVEPDEDELVLRGRDLANNVQDLRLGIDDVPRVEEGPLVRNLELTTPAPDTLAVSFQTTNATTPVIILDAGDRHVEEALDPGRDHEITVEELSPGSQARLTVTIPRGEHLVPALNATTPLPEDLQPPTELARVDAEPVEGGVELSWEPAEDDVGVREILIHRNGAEIARTSAQSYTDEPRTFEEHTYQLAAVDRAGNRGPWTEVSAEPIATFEITELTTEPETLTPEEPAQLQATIQTPAGLTPDIVTVAAGGQQLPMKLVDEGPYSSSYQVHTRLPTLNVAAEDTDLIVNATAGDRTETQRFPAPVVSSIGPTGDVEADEVPGFGPAAVLAALGSLAVARRRWCI